jgi:hypothetical protein
MLYPCKDQYLKTGSSLNNQIEYTNDGSAKSRGIDRLKVLLNFDPTTISTSINIGIITNREIKSYGLINPLIANTIPEKI